ncbi:uncharacterized protein LOC135847761 isoform X1 [Planococcus citri]|uniref:uncharacterized protein LOC135847761 isoform X1 n=1 Tax=Planococcus citri TaxID=170843 RepID=UPI0031F94126
MREIMNIRIQTAQILIAVWLACGQNGSSEQTMANSSEELLAYIDKHTLSVKPAVLPYEDVKKIFKSRRDFEKKYCDVVNDMANLHNEIDDMSEENHYLRESMPHTDFLCASDFMTHDLTEIFKNIAGVDYVDHYTPLEEWPFCIQEIRRIYDEFEPGRIHRYMRGKSEDPRKTDHVAYSKWCRFVTTDPYVIGFTNNAWQATWYNEEWNKVEDKWRSVAGHLQENLSEYFNKLDPEVRKLRYNNDKRNFSRTFSAIIQRGYRLSCYFDNEKRHQLDAALKTKYDNGTKIFFQTAIKRVEKYWYFPMEHIDMFNILINATHNDPARKIDHMFVVLKIPFEHDHYIIPGKRGCRKASYVTKRERKYPTKLTPPAETITPSRLNPKKP